MHSSVKYSFLETHASLHLLVLSKDWHLYVVLGTGSLHDKAKPSSVHLKDRGIPTELVVIKLDIIILKINLLKIV